MEKEKLPIKFFAPREIDEQKVEGRGNSEVPKWVLVGDILIRHSSELANSFSEFRETIVKREKQDTAIPFVFTAKIYEDATAKSRRKDITSLFKVSENENVIGLADSDKLIVKLDSLSQMDSILRRLRDYQHNDYAISCLETFWRFFPYEDIIDVKTSYKIKLIDFQNYGINTTMQSLFEYTLLKKNVEYKKTYYSNQMPIYKITNIMPDFFDKLRKEDVYEMLFSIEPMPKYMIITDSIKEEDAPNIIKPEAGKHYETLGILDNGVASIPQLSPWMAEERWTTYPEQAINPSHGTSVAGVALYGDMLEKQDWIGHKGIRIFDATIFPNTDKENLDEDELIANIQEAITANQDKIKVWNLSISIDRPISDTRFSDFAVALDALQEKYNVLICKSAGNCCNFLHGLSKGRIVEGADSVRSLVVGSMAHRKGISDFANIDNPSPFSRVGPGPEFIIKPEISHYGGNAGLNSNGKPTVSGIKTFSSDGKVISESGTSFSTPRVASLATGLFQEINEPFDPLLIKGLIIQSAAYSRNLLVPEKERTKYLGFGVPKSIPNILYNDSFEATLILRDTISKGEYIDIMDFPMPKSLIRNGFYTGQIIATLVYDPILDPTQGAEYCQSNIDIKFGSYDEKIERDISRRSILNPVGRQGAQNLFRDGLYSKRLMRNNQNDFALRERMLIQYDDKYYPVKKYAIDLSELSESNKQSYTTANKKWYLCIKGLFRNYIEQRALEEHFTPKQEMCLIITIRDPEHKSNIYDEVTQDLDAYNFWHSNIQITSDISVSI